MGRLTLTLTLTLTLALTLALACMQKKSGETSWKRKTLAHSLPGVCGGEG